MWAEFLMSVVFLNAIDSSHQSKADKEKEIPQGFFESFILDSGHETQIHPELIPYVHKTRSELQPESHKLKRNQKYPYAKQPLDLNLSVEEIQKAKRAEYDRGKNMERARKYHIKKAELRAQEEMQAQAAQSDRLIDLNVSPDQNENSEPKDEQIKKIGEADKAEQRRVKKAKFREELAQLRASVVMPTQVGQLHQPDGSSSSSEQNHLLQQPNLHINGSHEKE